MKWDVYIFRRSVMMFFWLSISIYSIYFCSDLLYKLDQFEQDVFKITRYYCLRVLPFFVVSMPTIAFVVQILLVLSLHQRKEWHIAKMLCISNFKLCRSIILFGSLLCGSWLVARELLLPKLVQTLILSEPNGDKEHSHIQILSDKNHLAVIKNKNLLCDSIDVDLLPLNTQNISGVWFQHQLNFLDHRWISEELGDRPKQDYTWLPTPRVLFHRENQYSFARFDELLEESERTPEDKMLYYCLLERLLFPLAFIYFFTWSALSVLRNREIAKVWVLPALCYVFFSVFCMTLKTMGMRWGGGILSLYLLTLCLSIPWVYSRFFRRRSFLV